MMRELEMENQGESVRMVMRSLNMVRVLKATAQWLPMQSLS